MPKHVLVTLTDDQYKCLSYLKGKMGSSDAEVLRNVFLAWVWEKMGGAALGECWTDVKRMLEGKTDK